MEVFGDPSSLAGKRRVVAGNAQKMFGKIPGGQLGKSQDGGQGRPQFVGNRRKKQRLETVEFGQADIGFGQFHGLRAQVAGATFDFLFEVLALVGQLGFHPLAIGNVGEHAERAHDFPRCVVQRAHGGQGPDAVPVFCDELEFGAVRFRPLTRLQPTAQAFGASRCQEGFRRAAKHAVGRKTQHVRHPLVGEDGPSFRIHDPNAFAGRFHDTPIFFLAFAKRRLGLMAIRDVADGFNGAGDVAGLVAQRHGLGPDPAVAAGGQDQVGLGDDGIGFQAGDDVPGIGRGHRTSSVIGQKRGPCAVKSRAVVESSLAEHILGLDAGQLLQSPVPEHHRTVFAKDERGVGQKVDDIGQTTVPGPQVGPNLAQVGDALFPMKVAQGQAGKMAGELVERLADFLEALPGHARHPGQRFPEARRIDADGGGVGEKAVKVGIYIENLAYKPVGYMLSVDENARAAIQQSATLAG